MYKAKKFISYMALCVLIFSLCACGEKGSENAAIYGETVGGLEDNELFAIIDTNASLPVLLVTSQVYNDGLGNQAALNCDVYYLIDKEVKNIGTIESMGTAYPIAYDEQVFMLLPVTICSVLKLKNPVRSDWQRGFMSNLTKVEMLLIP